MAVLPAAWQACLQAVSLTGQAANGTCQPALDGGRGSSAASSCADSLGLVRGVPLRLRLQASGAVPQVACWQQAHAKRQHSSAQDQPLGIVSKLSRTVVHQGNLLSAAALPAWTVLEFRPQGAVREVKRTTDELGLAPRDVSIFAPRRGLSSQRATLRPRDGHVLFRTELVKAVIAPDWAAVWPCKRHADSVHTAQLVYNNLQQPGDTVPFEMRVLEALLAATSQYFENKLRRLKFLAGHMQMDVETSLRAGDSELQRLLPIQSALTEMQHDVREAYEAISEVVNSEQLLAEMCLRQGQGLRARLTHQNPDMRLVAALLESYERQIQSVEGALKEMVENLDVAREVWQMQMSSVRNRLIRINLLVTIASFSLLMSTVPASFFGMNLASGLESSPAVFWPLVGSCLAGSALVFSGVYSYWRFWPNQGLAQQARDMTGLRDLLLHHVDDLDDLLAALRAARGGGREKFSVVLRERLGAMHERTLTRNEEDLLYRLCDLNGDGRLELWEVLEKEAALAAGSASSDAMAHRVASPLNFKEVKMM